MEKYKVWFNHPVDGKEVFTYIQAASVNDALFRAHWLDTRYKFAEKCREDM